MSRDPDSRKLFSNKSRLNSTLVDLYGTASRPVSFEGGNFSQLELRTRILSALICSPDFAD